jgi:hypothetical protein
MSNSMIVDDDVKAVAEFMQGRIAASRLVAVADGLAAMAPLLWGRFQPEAIQAIRARGGTYRCCAYTNNLQRIGPC